MAAKKASKTKTKTKSKTKNIDQKQHGGMTYSSCKVFHKPAKNTKAVALSPLSIWQSNATGGIHAATGKQGSGEAVTCNVLDIVNLSNVCNNSTPVGTNNLSQRLFVKSARSRSTFTNQSPVDLKLTILDMQPKKDLQSGLGPSAQWVKGISVNDYNGADSTSYQTVGNSILQFPQVTNEWKCINQTVINLSAGAHHTHTVFNSINRLLDQSTLYDTTTSSTRYYMKNYTIVSMFIVHGYPVDTTTSASSTVDVTTAPVKLIYTHEDFMSGKVMSGAPAKKVLYSVNNYPQPTTLYAEDEDGNGADTIMNAGVAQGYA